MILIPSLLHFAAGYRKRELTNLIGPCSLGRQDRPTQALMMTTQEVRSIRVSQHSCDQVSIKEDWEDGVKT